VQEIAAAAPAQPDDLGTIVSRVVDYLQTSELDDSKLSVLSTRHWSTTVSNELQAFCWLS